MRKKSTQKGTNEAEKTRFSLKDWGLSIGKNTIVGGASGAIGTAILSGSDMGVVTAVSAALGFLYGAVEYPIEYMRKKKKVERLKKTAIVNTLIFLYSLGTGVIVAAFALFISNYIAVNVAGFDVIEHLRAIEPAVMSSPDRAVKLVLSLLGAVVGIVTASFVRKLLAD